MGTAGMARGPQGDHEDNVGTTWGPWGPQISKNAIKLEQIEIIQFCLKIYDLWRHPHLWVGVRVIGWMDGWVDWWGQVK